MFLEQAITWVAKEEKTEECDLNLGLHAGMASPCLFNEQGLDGAFFPPQARINDVTLREGEQSAYVAFSWKDRCRIAHVLDEIGVPSIQLGFAQESSSDRGQAKALVESLERAKAQVLIVGFADDWKTQIDSALDCRIPTVRIVCRCSNILLEKLGISHDEMLERSRNSVAYARDQGARVEFSATDATRADLDYLRKMWKSAAEAGCSLLAIPDTVGVASPEAMAFLVEVASETTYLPIAVHCHNDFGLAVANTLASLRAGAEMVDVTVNGLGDRSGNASLDEVVMSLHLLYNVPTGIDVSRLTELCNLLVEITGIPLSEQKPIVGAQAFAHKLDIHVRMALQSPLTFQAFLPELVGNRQRVLFGSLSGPFGVRAKLKELGYPEPDEDAVQCVLAFVKTWALEKRAPLPDEALAEFLNRSKRTEQG